MTEGVKINSLPDFSPWLHRVVLVIIILKLRLDAQCHLYCHTGSKNIWYWNWSKPVLSNICLNSKLAGQWPDANILLSTSQYVCTYCLQRVYKQQLHHNPSIISNLQKVWVRQVIQHFFCMDLAWMQISHCPILWSYCSQGRSWSVKLKDTEPQILTDTKL